jgi:hypothetical protein
MSIAGLQVFPRVLETVSTQLVSQSCAIFNASTKLGMILQSGDNPGDYNSETVYDLLDVVQERNVYVDEANATADLARSVVGGVKVGYNTKTLNISKFQWSWIGRNEGEAGVVIARQIAPAFLKQKANLSIAALVAALQNMGSGVVHDTTTNEIDLAALTDAKAKFGDAYDRIVAWVMHSTPFFQLQKKGLDNGDALFTFATAKIFQDQMGVPFIVTDSPDLIADDGDYLTVGLTAGAVVMQENPGEFRANIETSNGRTSIKDTQQAEGTFNLTLKGCKWDEVNGGPSPLADALAVGTNWDFIYDSIKDGPGFLLRTNPT